MSVQSKNPPKFSSSKDYQTYKREVDTWTKVTKEEKKNWGNIIALSLPEDDPSDIRRKVFAGVAFDGEAGFKTLTDFLDEEFSKDNKKILMLYGPPGTGKSTMARVLAR